MDIDAGARALIELVEADRASRSKEILVPAVAQARAELAQARHAARLRVATAIAEERAAYAARVGAAEARLATARRMVRQRRLKALVAEGWQRLPAALAGRWADTASRRAWTEAALAHARAILPAAPWTLHGPASWSEAERAAAVATLAASGIEARCAGDPAIEAGVRAVSRNVEVDATLSGLTSDRAAIEGRLLHFFEETPA
jgi:hypothetical protein